MSIGPRLTFLRRIAHQTMNDRCTIVRGTAPTYDTAATFTPYLSNVPCHFWEETDTEQDERGATAVIRRSRLLLPIGTDIRGTDEVTSVTDQLGSQRLPLDSDGNPRSYGVVGDPITHASHIEVALGSVS